MTFHGALFQLLGRLIVLAFAVFLLTLYAKASKDPDDNEDVVVGLVLLCLVIGFAWATCNSWETAAELWR